MVQMRGERVPLVKNIIVDTITRPHASREKLIRTMQVPVSELASSLTDRLPSRPDLTELFAALDRVDDETLAILIESRGWETWESGNPETDGEAILHVSEPEDEPVGPPLAPTLPKAMRRRSNRVLPCGNLADAAGGSGE